MAGDFGHLADRDRGGSYRLLSVGDNDRGNLFDAAHEPAHADTYRKGVMNHLRIEIYGPAIYLVVGLITREQKYQLEKACSFMGLYWKKRLNDLWYGNSQTMRRILGVADWREVATGGHRYCGPLLGDRRGLSQLLDATGVFVNDREVRLNPARISTHFKKPKAPPRLTPQNLAVCHGEYYEGYTCYHGQVTGAFDPKALSITFVDCGENGFVLEDVTYAGTPLKVTDQVPERERLKLRFIQSPD